MSRIRANSISDAQGTGSPTFSNGLVATGVVTALNFVGDGSGLTHVTSTGVGVQIRHDDIQVGTAATINFGSNTDVSPIRNGIVTVSSVDTNTTYTLPVSDDGSGNALLTLTGSDASTDQVLVTAGSNVTFGSISGGGFTINATAGGGADLAANNLIVSGVSTLGVVTGATYYGNGAGITALNASNLSSGTVPDGRFPAVLPAVSGQNLTNLPGGITTSNVSTNTLVVSGVSTLGTVNATAVLASQFYGDGSGLTNVGLDTSNLTANTLVVTGVSTLGVVNATSFSGDGSGLTNVGVDTASVTTDTLVVTGVSTLGVVNTGALTASSFSGTGTNITSLNASNLSSGTVPSGRFPAVLPAVSGANLTFLLALLVLLVLMGLLVLLALLQLFLVLLVLLVLAQLLRVLLVLPGLMVLLGLMVLMVLLGLLVLVQLLRVLLAHLVLV